VSVNRRRIMNYCEAHNIIYHGDNINVLKTIPDNHFDAVVTDPPYGLSFMGHKWDYDIPSVTLWKEVLRVVKPGGHVLVACGTRTQHRMAVNLEDAGFEIRDLIAWVYGGGFPKNHNIGKAVDKLQNNPRQESTYLAPDGRPRTQNSNSFMQRVVPIDTISQGHSAWEGWGTALRPSMELWTLCRKPISEKTVAKNCLKWGTGGVNVDACRIPTDDHVTIHGSAVSSQTFSQVRPCKPFQTDGQRLGRYPANVIHDGSEEVVSLFPVTHPSKAARFFYCAKASTKERNLGCEHLDPRQVTGGGGLVAQQRDDGTLETSSLGGKYGSVKAVKNNYHPTVKPIALMEYLCKLVTPHGGLILDPYLGSGTTMVAALKQGYRCYGIEINLDYIAIAKARVEYYLTDHPDDLIIK
jgi:DNA modification methylase